MAADLARNLRLQLAVEQVDDDRFIANNVVLPGFLSNDEVRPKINVKNVLSRSMLRKF